jgi:branched-chain amino acid transport system ATP-binding protein
MGLGYVPQGRLLFPSLSVEEHLHLFHRPLRKGGGFEWTAGSVYELFPILKDRQKISGTLLSGGEQQMLAIGRALVTNPSLLIMDEPTEGLSPTVIHQIVETCRKLHETGVAMLLTEQNLEVAAELADRTLILETGRFVHQALKADYGDGEAFKDNLSKFMKI